MNKHRILCRANRLEGGEVHALLVLRNLNERSTEGKVQQTTLVEQEPQDRAPVIPTVVTAPLPSEDVALRQTRRQPQHPWENQGFPGPQQTLEFRIYHCYK